MLVEKKDIKGILIIFLVLVMVSVVNYLISFRNDRDEVRDRVISELQIALIAYKADYGEFPLSSPEGDIIACRGSETKILKDEAGLPVVKAQKPLHKNLISCVWGKDSLLDIEDINYPHYMDTIPRDPLSDKGYRFIYVSNGEVFKLLGSYEGKIPINYDKKLKEMKIDCGVKYCNFGKASGVPLYDEIPVL